MAKLYFRYGCMVGWICWWCIWKSIKNINE